MGKHAYGKVTVVTGVKVVDKIKYNQKILYFTYYKFQEKLSNTFICLEV